MKILLIHQYFLELNDGGGSRFNEMTKLWTKKGHEVTVLAGMMHANGSEKIPEYKGKRFVRKLHDKVEVIRCHVSESYNQGFLGRLWGYFSFVFSSIWAGFFKVKGKYDVILVTSPPLFVGITAYVLSIFKRTPFVFEVRDLWPESAIDTGVVTNKWIIKFAYWFEAFIYRKAKAINVLTPAFKEKLVFEKNVPAEKVLFIPNAADFSLSESIMNSAFDPLVFRKELGWGDKVVVTYVGAHGVANHLIQILIAAAELQKQNSTIHFVLIGAGMEKDKLINEAVSRHLDNVTFINPVPKQDVFKYILASDYGASVLKKVDTFKTIYSNKTFDYMSCKKPVVIAIDGVSRDLINHAKCGVYIEPENTATWVEQMKWCERQSEEEKSRLGENGYNYAKKHFDRKQLAIQYLEEINKRLNIE